MKSILFILVFFNVTCIAQQYSGSAVLWNQSRWQKVKLKARNEHKFIFVDCFTTWCTPCKAMDKEVYTNKKLREVLERHAIAVKEQMDTAKNDDRNIKQRYHDAHQMMMDYKIFEFPTCLIFSNDGRIIYRIKGYTAADILLKIIDSLPAIDSEYSQSMTDYENGVLDSLNYRKLAYRVKSIGDPELAHRIANRFIDHLNNGDLFSPDNIVFMKDFTQRSGDRGFHVFRDSSDRITSNFTRFDKGFYRGFVENIIYKEAILPFIHSKEGNPDWDMIGNNVELFGEYGKEALANYKPGIIFKSEISPLLQEGIRWPEILDSITTHPAEEQEFLIGSSIVYYANQLLSNKERDCGSLIAAASLYIKRYPTLLNAPALNTWSWCVFKHSAAKGDLEIALAWSQTSIQLIESQSKQNKLWHAEIIDTYANLLYKLGKTEEGISWEQKALDIEPNNREFTATLEKMKKGEPTWLGN